MLHYVVERFMGPRPYHVRAKHLVYFGAACSLFIGLLAFASWLECWPGLICAWSVPMYADGALLCVLSGAGLLTALRHNYIATRAVGIILASVANLHLTASLAGFSISVHKLFPELAANILPAAQAAHVQLPPVTAMVFFFFGCALAMLSPRNSNHVLAVRAAIGAVISATGAIVLSRYIGTGVTGAVHEGISHMPFLTAVCAIMLGLATCALCAMEWDVVSQDTSPTSILIGAIGILLVLGGADTAAVVSSRAATILGSDIDLATSQIRTIRKVMDLVRSADTNVQLFLLTRDDKFRAGYTLAATAVRGAVNCNELPTISQWQESHLRDLIAARFALLDSSIDLERLDRHAEAVQQLVTGQGAVLNEQIERRSGDVISVLRAEAASRKTDRQIVLKNLMHIIMVSYIVAVLLVAITILLAYLQAKQHKRASLKAAAPDGCDLDAVAEFETTSESARSQKNVLLIEDSEDIMFLVAHALEKHGCGQYRLLWANCLKEGFRHLTQRAADLVLLDLGLPETSGAISYACVRGCAPEVPVLVMTGDDSHETEDSIAAAGADGYLVKQQISGAQLVNTIEAILATRNRPPQRNLKSIARNR